MENCSSLRIDFTDIYDKKWVAEYEGFYISNADDGYRIHVYGYSGNASDALEYQNKMQFSAVDSDRDISNTHCAQNYEGGWWFSHCQHANLNGRYNLGLTWFDGTTNEWIAVSFSEMKVKRRKNCATWNLTFLNSANHNNDNSKTHLYGLTQRGTLSVSHILCKTMSNCDAMSSWRRSSPHLTMTERSFQLERWP